MIAFNSIKYYSSLKDEFEKLNKSINFIKENNSCNEKQRIIKEFLNSKVGEGNASTFSYIIKRDSTSSIESLKSDYLNKFENFRSKFNILDFFGTLREVERSFESLCVEYNYKDDNCNILLEHLNCLAKLYQTVVQSNLREDIVIFFDESEKVCAEYFLMIKGLASFIESLESNYEDISTSKNNILELQLLEVDFSIGEFGKILSIIETSYNSLKMIFDDSSISDLKIIKIESGSLLAKVLGNNNVIELLTVILRKITTEVYQKFTLNGKLEKQSNIMKSISEASDISVKLSEMGIDTTEANGNLKDCLNVATNGLYKIVEKTGKMKINDDIVSVGEKQKLIEYKTLYLESVSISDEVEND